MKKFFAVVILNLILICNVALAADENQSQIAEYEKIIDLFDLDNEVDEMELLNNAQKLQAIDPHNLIAFRATVHYYRKHGELQTAIYYCNSTAKFKYSTELTIEAYYQLADIYQHEFNVPFRVQKFLRKGIDIVKKKYSRKEIEKFVNGTNIIYDGKNFHGKTNTIRDLYILKNEYEKSSPKIEETAEGKIFKYQTDW